jgi:hypothetical protein
VSPSYSEPQDYWCITCRKQVEADHTHFTKDITASTWARRGYDRRRWYKLDAVVGEDSLEDSPWMDPDKQEGPSEEGPLDTA